MVRDNVVPLRVGELCRTTLFLSAHPKGLFNGFQVKNRTGVPVITTIQSETTFDNAGSD